MTNLFVAVVHVDRTADPRITPAVEVEIAERYRAGQSAASLRKRFRLDHQAIVRILGRAGVPLHPRRPASGPHRESILSMHDGGKSIKQISAELGINFATVYRVLLRTDRVRKKRS